MTEIAGLGLGLGLRSTRRAATVGGWTPSSLGASLLGLWDAERAATLTLAGALVTTWADAVAGYAATQATTARKPTYSATGLLGTRPAITFDGADDSLTMAAHPFANGAAACEVWALCQNTSDVADATNRIIFGYGGNTGPVRRTMYRARNAGVNNAQSDIGTGASVITPPNAAVFGVALPNVLRLSVGATSSQLSVDNVAGAALDGVPGTTAGVLRIAALPATVASAFFRGNINLIAVTAPLSAGEAAAFYTYLDDRRI